MNREHPRGFVPESAEPPPSDEEITREWRREQESPLSAFERLDLENLVAAKLQEYPALRVHGAEPALRDIITRQLLERRALLDERNKAEKTALRAAFRRKSEKHKRLFKGILAGGSAFIGAEAAVLTAYPDEVRGTVDSLNPFHVADMREPASKAPDATASGGAEAATQEGSLEVREWRDADLDVTAMDRFATPERMRRLLSVMPSGWVRDMGRIAFKDETGFQVANMAKGNFAAAQALEGADGRTDVIFFKGSKEVDREFRLGATLPHEISHGNDWEDDGDLTDDQKSQLRTKVILRLNAQDRFVSAYVEGIDPDAAEQREREYWGEINEAYWSHERLSQTGLPKADAEIIDWHIRLTDPHFDREKAVRAYRGTLREMSLEERLPAARKALGDGSDGERGLQELLRLAEARNANWGSLPSTDFSLRENLVAKVADWADTEERRAYAEALMETHARRERLVSELLSLTAADEGSLDGAAAAYARAVNNLAEFGGDAGLGEGTERFTAEVEGFIRQHDLLIGEFAMGMQVIDLSELDVLEDLALRKSGAPEPWALRAFGWTDASLGADTKPVAKPNAL